jgi:hypothetical protein
LGEGPLTVSLPFARLVNVSHEAQSDLELVRFEFDRSVPGDVTATADTVGPGRFLDANLGEAVVLQGGQFTSIRLDGLIGGASTDQIRSDPADPHGVRQVVQVLDEGQFRWIIGTIAGTCRRLNANVADGLIVLAVVPR